MIAKSDKSYSIQPSSINCIRDFKANPQQDEIFFATVIEILLVWLLLNAVFKRCYYGNHNATDIRSEYCKFMYNIIIIKYSVSRIQFLSFFD